MDLENRIFPILQWLPGYKKSYLTGDIFAGLTVGVMLIPQGMAYALIAGLPPVYGLYAAIVPQLIYALLGTSRQLAVGPVAMDSLLVATGVSLLAMEGTEAYVGFTIMLAFLVGIFQMLFGLFKMGFITNLLSRPVISGFTSAAAIIIALNQLKYLLGVEVTKSTRIHEVVIDASTKIQDTHLLTFGIGLVGIIVIKGVKRINAMIPGALIAVVLGIVTIYFFQLDEKGVAVVGTIPSGMPQFLLPHFSLGQLSELIPLALTIAVVAFMESYSVAKSIEAKRRDHKVNPNRELIGLGAANFFGSLFQSYPIAGGFSRSAVNDQAGANTPLSSVISAGLIALTLLFLTPLFYFLPNAILASIIMVAVYNLIDFSYARTLWRENKVEFVLLFVTFIITLSFSMVPGIVSGVVLSILILLYRAANPHIAVLGRLRGRTEFRNVKRFSDLEVWPDKLIVRVDAALTFINIQFLKDFLELELSRNKDIKAVIIDAASVSYVDATAALGLTEIVHNLKQRQIDLLLTDVIGPVRDILFRTGLLKEIGVDNIYLSLNDAIERASHLRYQNREAAIQHGLLEEGTM